MYDRTNCGQNLRRFTAVNLAPWHNYKWASYQIMRVFGRDFIGPFFHALFPDVAFDTNKMRFPAVCTLLSYMRLAYPQFRERLIIARQQPAVNNRALSLLDNMWSMFEFFIPVV